MSLLEWEIRSIGDEMDLYSRMEHVGRARPALRCIVKF